jgi:hypothetical protein
MEPIYANVILWAVFLFLGYFGLGEFLVRSLKRPEFMDLGRASKVALGLKIYDSDVQKRFRRVKQTENFKLLRKNAGG